MEQKKTEQPRWFRLDNAAKIYPAIKERNWTAVFRISVLLKDTIDPILLEEAVVRVAKRFPSLCVRLRKGFFWYYLEEIKKPVPSPKPDISNPCLRFRWKENDGYLFRIYYYQNRISIEFFHSLTDGAGATAFVKTIAAEYLRLKGIPIGTGEGVYDIQEEPDPKEWEDAYGKYATSGYTKNWSEDAAYHFKGTSELPGKMNIITGIVPTDKLLATAKSYQVTMTEYLAALLVTVFYQLQNQQQPNPKRRKNIKIQVPVNMRGFYPTKTLRNFSLYVMAGINPRLGEFTFEEILKQLHHTLRSKLTEKELNSLMTQNVKTERNPFVRVVPLFLKNFIMAMVYRMAGDRINSVVLTNVGRTTLPEEMKEYVERFDYMLGPTKAKTPNLSVGSFENNTVLCFSSALQETDVEREFFRLLVKAGIPVSIESNRN